MDHTIDTPLISSIYNRYGSKKGFLRYLFFQAAMYLGRYNRYRIKNLEHIQRIVFVCMGNICRSPLAEAYATSFGIEAESCGISCQEGFKADPRAIAYGKSLGVGLESHRTRSLQNFEFRPGDLVVGMEPAHLTALRKMALPGVSIGLAGLWCRRKIAYIHDPYNCSKGYFSHCESLIVDSVGRLLDQKKKAP
ncbi:arsenate reductase/protein-tyrosine-phosphatase family protein [Marinobacter sp. SS21]|uniref:arsenate reductase/protein-tyrosine-phosphatase family protein n=1 Tax=Marinobacter sp. SS21 TaxID=2979460 RepID=UPI003FA578E9